MLKDGQIYFKNLPAYEKCNTFPLKYAWPFSIATHEKVKGESKENFDWRKLIYFSRLDT